uniref:Uncharacterized protein n=1 Tax=Rhizophora mucronata TaxID=61149 RepID=A0A2P2P6G1_RHIMU
MARIGGMLCPLVAVSLVQGCHQAAAVALFVGVVFVAGICTIFFPYDTMGRDLMERMPGAKEEEPKDVQPEEPRIEP